VARGQDRAGELEAEAGAAACYEELEWLVRSGHVAWDGGSKRNNGWADVTVQQGLLSRGEMDEFCQCKLRKIESYCEN
jgi:hypothetical protein